MPPAPPKLGSHVPRHRAPEVLIDPRAGQALAQYAQHVRLRRGAILGTLEARVTAMEDLPRYKGVPLDSDALARELPKLERSDS